MLIDGNQAASTIANRKELRRVAQNDRLPWAQGNGNKETRLKRKPTNKQVGSCKVTFLYGTATVYQADYLVLIEGFQSDWFKMPFLGKPKLHLFGDVALSVSDSILGRRLFIPPVRPAPPN